MTETTKRILNYGSAVLFLAFIFWIRADEGRRDTGLQVFLTIAITSSILLGLLMLYVYWRQRRAKNG